MQGVIATPVTPVIAPLTLGQRQVFLLKAMKGDTVRGRLGDGNWYWRWFTKGQTCERYQDISWFYG